MSLFYAFMIWCCTMMLYSFMGWFWESTFYSLGEQGIFMNRGYFLGPYCPIYGVVIYLNVYLLAGIGSPLRIFLVSAMVCTVVEYATSWTLEKLFQARYWDYSNYPLNINGRVSVPSSAFFGVAIMVMVSYLHPFFWEKLQSLPYKVTIGLGITCCVVFWTDFIITVISMNNLNKKCKKIYESFDGYVEEKFDDLNEKKEVLNKYRVVRAGQNFIVKAKGVNQRFLNLETRYLKRPGFRSVKYGDIMDKMKVSIGKFKSGNLSSEDEDIWDDFE